MNYRGVNKEVWDLLIKIYGGGPMIARDQLNIYSKDISKDFNQNQLSKNTMIMM